MEITEGNRKGDIGELIASTWLLKKGYEVFRNMGSTGPADIVAIRLTSPFPNDERCNLEIRIIDVKSSARGHYKQKHEDYEIEFLYVNLDNNTVSFNYKEAFPAHGKKLTNKYMKHNPRGRKLKLIRDKKWKEDNPDYIKNYNKNYYAKNKEKILENRSVDKKISTFFNRSIKGNN